MPGALQFSLDQPGQPVPDLVQLADTHPTQPAVLYRPGLFVLKWAAINPE